MEYKQYWVTLMAYCIVLQSEGREPVVSRSLDLTKNNDTVSINIYTK